MLDSNQKPPPMGQPPMSIAGGLPSLPNSMPIPAAHQLASVPNPGVPQGAQPSHIPMHGLNLSMMGNGMGAGAAGNPPHHGSHMSGFQAMGPNLGLLPNLGAVGHPQPHLADGKPIGQRPADPNLLANIGQSLKYDIYIYVPYRTCNQLTKCVWCGEQYSKI